jgi:ATP-dependent Clp protease ATP-binding subunit ClpA
LGTDLTSIEYLNKMDPVIGRDKEVNRIIEIVMKKNKCNPLLIGPAGVGKTSIVEEFARRIVNMQVPVKLYNYKVFSLSMASLVSGTKYRGEFEEKVLKIIKIAENSNVILFIDEIHTLVGAGGAEGAIDASNILKPALARGNIIVIGATTNSEYKKYIENDKALVRRFDLIEIKEPEKEELIHIINGIKSKYEEYHNVKISNEIIDYIIRVSSKYFFYKKEPDRTIDFLDEICSYASSLLNKEQLNNIKLKKELTNIELSKQQAINNNNYSLAKKYRENEREIESTINSNELNSNNKTKKITTEIVNKVLSDKCNIHVKNGKSTKIVLSYHKKEFKKIIIGQNDIVDKVLDNTKFIFDTELIISKPIILFFYGSKGVGKKYLSTQLGKKIFNNNYYYHDLSFSKLDQDTIKELKEKSKNKPFFLYIFDNYDNCNHIIKEHIRNQINDNKTNNNLMFIFISNIKETIGFNNNENINDSKTINFNNLTKEDIRKIIKINIKQRNINYNKLLIDNIIAKLDNNLCLRNLNNIIDQYLINEKLIV